MVKPKLVFSQLYNKIFSFTLKKTKQMTLKDKTIGTKIRMWRVAKELSQENVADELKISKNSYMKIESNEVSVTFERLEQIAQILGISILKLISLGEGSMIITGNSQTNEHGTNIFLNQGAENDIMLELEKLRIEKKADKEHIQHLTEQLNSLKEIIALMKNSSKGMS
jgi:transcriptional regulator with XRE-family HTH domain